MNFKDKRTKRICAASASAAVIVAGGVVVASFASATGSLALTTGNTVTALDLGKQLTGAVQTLKTTAAANTAGTFALTFGSDTATIAYNADPASITTALNNLASISNAGKVDVTCRAGAADVHAQNTICDIAFRVPGVRPAITVDNTSLTGGTMVINAGASSPVTGGALNTKLADATFATKVTTPISTSGHLKLTLDSYTAPAGVTVSGTPALFYNDTQASGSATGPTATWTSLSTPTASSATSGALIVASGGSPTVGAGVASTQDVFLTGNVPGTYTFHFSDDNNSVGTGDDALSPTVTMTVLDAEGATSAPSDDWAPAVSASPTTGTYGAAVTASISFSDVSTVDTRSSNSGIGVLGSKIAALVGGKFTGTGSGAGTLGNDISGGVTDYTVSGPVTATATGATRTLPAGIAVHTGTVTSSATFDKVGDASALIPLGGTAGTLIDTNGVTAIATDLAVAAATGTVAAGTHTATIKSGTADATYSVKVTDASNPADDVVQFKLTPTTGTPGLTANGTLVGTVGTVKTYAVTADSTGVATIKVTSDKTTAGTVYKVDASSNNVSANQLTATYQDSMPSTFKVTSTAADLSPQASGTANLKGQLLDQFSASYAPTGADPRQVSLFLGSTASALGTANTATSTATTQMPLAADGSFSYAYKPVATPTAGSQTAFTFAYDKDASGTYNTGEPGKDGAISWASATAVATVAITAPTSTATSTLPIADAHAAPSTVVQTINGTVSDAGSAGLAYKTVTLTGTNGVKFATDNLGTGLVDSIQVPTNGTGAFTAYAIFTMPGTATITATSETKTATATEYVHAQAAARLYNVTVNNAAGMPNSPTVVSGKVTDAFGNPVPGATVSLTPDDVTLGVLAAPGLTNANGEYSATYTAGAVAGKVKVTASITPDTVATTWSTVAGLTLPAAVPTATGSITIAPDAVALAAPKSRLGAGAVSLTGTARPGATVDIYRKTSTGLVLVDSVTADSKGAFSSSVTVSVNTVFVAKSPTAASPAVVVKVVSTAKITTKAGRRGRLTVTVTGGPGKRGTVTLYQVVGKKLVKLGSVYTRKGGYSWSLKAGKGTKTFKAVYTSSGCASSAVVAKTVKL